MADDEYERSEELSLNDDFCKDAEKLYDAIMKGFDDQRDRSDNILDYWDMYDCKLGRAQNYSGMSQIFVPICRNGVNALVTRYVNQAFPQSGRHVECVTGEIDKPHALLGLIENYIDRTKLRTQAAVESLLNGQVEGQYNCYFRWQRTRRVVVSKKEMPIVIDGTEHPELGTIETVIEEEIEDAIPVMDVLHDNDVLVLPATATSVEAAIEMGGCAVILRRWTEDQIEDMIRDGDIDEYEGQNLIDEIGQGADENKVRDAAKALAYSAGIKVSRNKIFALVWEVWAKRDIDGKGTMRLCRLFFSGEKKLLGARRNPYWNDRCPLRSAAVKKSPGVLKGESPLSSCQGMQILANDMANEAADQMYYAMAPIVAVDPEKVSKWKELVADVASVWPVEPNGVKMIEWPNKAQEAFNIIGVAKAQIFETLGVNPGMLPQQTGVKGSKRNQAEVALEQQVDLLQTADAVTVFQEEILTPFVQWAAELDHQFRDKDTLVREFGELGLKASMDTIPPIQWDKRWEIRWVGIEVARNAANLQQQIAFINVVKAIPPQLLDGYRLKLAPVIEASVGAVFGARLGRQTFVSPKDDQGVDPKIENEMLVQSFEVLVHIGDRDAEHIAVHMKLPASPNRDAHIKRHQLQMALKQQAQQPPGGLPGSPGGAGPGAPGTPRPGAMPAQQRPVQQPPGAIHRDRMPRMGTVVMPRKT